MADRPLAPKIDKGIPLPVGRYSSSWYRWDEMEVGDSFAVLGRKKMSGGIAHQQTKHPEKQFIFRMQEETQPDGSKALVTRVWRTK